jgi:hypothetical protein
MQLAPEKEVLKVINNLLYKFVLVQNACRRNIITRKIWGFSRRWLWRKQSSGMWRRVDLVLTDVSEERIASIFRIEDKKKSSSEPALAGSTICCNSLLRRYVPPKRRLTQIPEDSFLHLSVCVSVYSPLLTGEPSLWKLVCILWHLIPSQRYAS